MRKDEQSFPVVEWSSSQVSAYDSHTRQHYSGASLSEIAPLLSSKTVVIALSRRSSFVRTVRVPDAPKQQVAQVLRIQLPNVLPIAPHEVAFDFRLTKDVTIEGRLAVVAAVQIETLTQLHRDLKAAGLQAKLVVPMAFGSWLLARSLNLEACAVVEHVSEGLAIDVIAGEELRYTRIVPFPKSSEAIDAEVCRTFSVAHVPCSHIVAAAGLKFANVDTTVATKTIEVFGTGLLSKLDINIELPEAVEARTKKAALARARLAVAAWLGVAVAGAVVFLDRADAAGTVQKSQAPYLANLGQLNAGISGVKSKMKTESAYLGTLQRAFQPAQSPSDVITSLTSKIPDGRIWIGGITFERGKPLLIRGTSMDSNAVAAYVQALAVDQRFRDVTLVFANNGTLEDTPIVEFAVQAHVVGNLPINQEKSKGGSS